MAVIQITPQRADNVIYLNETVALDGSASYDPDQGDFIASYDWQEPCCGTLGQASTASHSWSSTGTKTISLTVGDNENPRNYTTETIDIEVKAAPGRYYYVTDHLGSVRATVDENGNLVGYDDFYPFGLQMAGRSGIGDDKTREKFTGHELDEDTGLVYAGARYYAPEIGRWMSVDPLADQYPGFSPYNYVLNNPTKLFDPDGKAPQSCPPFCGPVGNEFKNRLRGFSNHNVSRSRKAIANRISPTCVKRHLSLRISATPTFTHAADHE